MPAVSALLKKLLLKISPSPSIIVIFLPDPLVIAKDPVMVRLLAALKLVAPAERVVALVVEVLLTFPFTVTLLSKEDRVSAVVVETFPLTVTDPPAALVCKVRLVPVNPLVVMLPFVPAVTSVKLAEGVANPVSSGKLNTPLLSPRRKSRVFDARAVPSVNSGFEKMSPSPS